MSLLSKAKMVSGDRKKTPKGKGHAVKKVDRKVAEKQTPAVGNTYAINTATEAKPEIQQTALHPPKKTVKKLITQSAVKSLTQKPSTKKTQSTKQPLIKIQKSQSKKSPSVRNPDSTILNKVETKRKKSTKQKQTHSVGNTNAINSATEAKPEIQQTALHPPKKAVRKLITQSAVKSPTQKPSTKKNQSTKQLLIKIQKSQSKKSPGAKNPNSTILNKVETKRKKSTKRVLKAIPMIVTLPKDTTSNQADGTTKTNPAEKQLVKVKRVLRKKLLSSLNGKTTKQDTVSSMAVENVIPINNTTKLLAVMTKQT